MSVHKVPEIVNIPVPEVKPEDVQVLANEVKKKRKIGFAIENEENNAKDKVSEKQPKLIVELDNEKNQAKKKKKNKKKNLSK